MSFDSFPRSVAVVEDDFRACCYVALRQEQQTRLSVHQHCLSGYIAVLRVVHKAANAAGFLCCVDAENKSLLIDRHSARSKFLPPKLIVVTEVEHEAGSRRVSCRIHHLPLRRNILRDQIAGVFNQKVAAIEASRCEHCSAFPWNRFDLQTVLPIPFDGFHPLALFVVLDRM